MSLTSVSTLNNAKLAIERREFQDGWNSLREIACFGDLRPESYTTASQLMEKLVGRLPGIPSQKVAVLGAYTTQPLVAAVRVALLREGWLTDVYEAPFGAIRQEILDPNSGLYNFAPDVVVIASDISEIGEMPAGPLSDSEIKSSLAHETEAWTDLWSILAERLTAPVLQHTFETPADNFLGVAERRIPWAADRFIDALNGRLIASAPGFLHWVDVDRLAARVGRQNWRDLRLYHHGKIGFSLRFLPEYARLLGAVWRSATSSAKKALIVDLDNTLWGGVIGDDGMEGIRLGPSSAEGEAYQNFANYLRELKQRGVILGICSKNDQNIAAEVFDKHPHMTLKREDFAAFVCNWQDKATNLRDIADDLNIDISSLAFADDDRAECELVRRELPQVEVIHLAGDPANFRHVVDQRHLFDTSALSEADLQRADSYTALNKAARLRGESSDLEGFWASLAMVATVKRAGPSELSRLAQMEMKTNQFNLTTRRLTSDDIGCMIDDPDTLVLALSLSDRFTDHGLVSSIIACRDGDTLTITDWLMSCRVFSRTVEEFLLNVVIDHARSMGCQTLVGEYRPTVKNNVVANLYTRLGFSPDEMEGGRFWNLDVDKAVARPNSIKALDI